VKTDEIKNKDGTLDRLKRHIELTLGKRTWGETANLALGNTRSITTLPGGRRRGLKRFPVPHEGTTL